MPHYDYDVIVIGGGSGGLTVATGTAKAGKRTLMVNANHIGGDCTNTGCVLSKSLLHAAYHRTDDQSMRDLLRLARATRAHYRAHETPASLKEIGISYQSGTASFVDPHTIRITPSPYPTDNINPPTINKHPNQPVTVTARHIVIATGAVPRLLTIDGVPDDRIETYATIFELDEQTDALQHLVIVGGGYIACEIAECFVRGGISVTMIIRGDRLIARAEPSSSDYIDTYLRDLGVTILYHSQITSGSETTLQISTTTQSLPYDRLLIAIGRQPQTTGLMLDDAGIETDPHTHGIITNTAAQTSVPHIYAIGDCVHANPQFSHRANHQGRAVVTSLIVPLWKKTTNPDHCPSVLYTHHEIAQIGQTSTQLDEIYGAGHYVTLRVEMAAIDRAIITDETDGHLIVHATKLTGKILGATIIGPHAGELLPLLSHIYTGNHSLYQLSSLIVSYPTRAAILKKIGDEYLFYTLAHRGSAIRERFGSHAGVLIAISAWVTLISTIWISAATHGRGLQTIFIKLKEALGVPLWGPILYIIAYALRPLILLPASILTTLSGYLFGGWGILFTAIGENTSASVAYLLGRYFGHSFVNPRKRGVINTLAKRLNNGNTFLRVLTMRLLGVPFDLVNYGCGILKVARPPYAIATLLGIIPGMTAFVLIGNAFADVPEPSFAAIKEHIDARYLILGVGLFVLSVVLTKLREHRHKKSQKNNTTKNQSAQ